MNQPTLFGMVTPGMKLQFHGLPGPEHRLEVVKIRQGQAWLRKPCGATYVYPVEDIWEHCEEVAS